jgi:3,4-dihydroxy 2-butanone 4-phosphate synthase/GTP cyclohydrolase II
MTSQRADELELSAMAVHNTDPHATAFTITVDHLDSGTGVSAASRALTFRALADPGTRPEHLRRPGHIFPLRARPGGVLERPGHTEAAIDLLQLAGRAPIAVISELIGEDGEMMRGPELWAFARSHGLPVLAIEDLVRYRRESRRQVERVSSATLPTSHGEFQAVAYRSVLDGTEHLALVKGDLAAADNAAGTLVRVHSECLTGDTLGSLRCDCGAQLERAISAVANEGCGVIIYLRGHEGRGIGLADKIRAYALQERGYDTVDANLALGLPVDARDYEVAAAILADLGIKHARLMTNNPEKEAGLRRAGLLVASRVAMVAPVNSHNVRYLSAKRDRMGHQLTADVDRNHCAIQPTGTLT